MAGEVYKLLETLDNLNRTNQIVGDRLRDVKGTMDAVGLSVKSKPKPAFDEGQAYKEYHELKNRAPFLGREHTPAEASRLAKLEKMLGLEKPNVGLPLPIPFTPPPQAPLPTPKKDDVYNLMSRRQERKNTELAEEAERHKESQDKEAPYRLLSGNYGGSTPDKGREHNVPKGIDKDLARKFLEQKQESTAPKVSNEEVAMDAVGAAEGNPIAIAKLVKDGYKKVKEQMGKYKEVGHELNNMAHAENAEDIGGHMFGAGEKLGGAIGSPALEAVSKFGKQVMESLGALRKWSDQLQQANFQFAEFSGAMAAVQARQEVRDIELSIKRGDRRAESAEYLSQGRSELNSRLAVIEDGFAVLKNWALGFVNKSLTKVIDVLTIGLLKTPEDDESKGLSMNEFLAETSRHFWNVEEHNKPERFK